MLTFVQPHAASCFKLLVLQCVPIGQFALSSHLFILLWCHFTRDYAPETSEKPPSCTAHMYDH